MGKVVVQSEQALPRVLAEHGLTCAGAGGCSEELRGFGVKGVTSGGLMGVSEVHAVRVYLKTTITSSCLVGSSCKP